MNRAPAFAPSPPRPVFSMAVFGGLLVLLGLLSGVPFLLGPVLAVAGVGGSALLRRSPRLRNAGVELAPAAVALGILALTAPAVPSTELFAGLSALALLLWIADEPGAPAGAWMRAVPWVGLGAVGLGAAWAVVLSLSPGRQDVGAASVLLVAALLVAAVALFLAARRARSETA